jgi:probable phosphoglycerate mutase
MTILLLIRHGSNDWVGQRLAGWTPEVHLNEVGQRQADALIEQLADVPLTAIYSSPLERAQETAAPLAQHRGLPVTTVADLGEVRYGAWQGRALKELAKTELWQQVQRFPSRTRFPQGESLMEAQGRVVQALEELVQEHPGDDAVLAAFSHGDVIKAAIAHYMGLHLDLFQRLVISPASVSVLVLGKSGPHLIRLNDTGKLSLQPPKSEED